MTAHALVVGGTRFIGRHTVEEFLEAGYDVTVFNRGNHENPFADRQGVDRVEGDRTNDADLRRAALDVDPDVVVDCVAYYPRDVHTATDIFEDVDAYVYISSGAAYGAETIPKREDETALEECSADEAIDDSYETYGKRKAEGDRAVFEAAGRGVNAMAVRPPVVYGPHDYTERFDYWIDRVDTHDRIVVPGDGTNLWHLVYVKDVASALRTVAEEGTPGEAYNVGDDHAPVLDEWVDLLADACDTDVETVHASARELGAVDVEPGDFPIYRHYPHLLDTTKLRSLGWESTPHEEALAVTVADHRDSDRTGREEGPDRETEERLMSVLETVE
ncbi:NAD-dependent epimerase/dehydratase family protein [Natronomonas salina]|uniref:NAD-dependent epimerase/dehydratase family protein n=1 Tax=Natronomonas salina TaxID=1710540 RepID=UPI0015B405C7|nr:NAD-dependent epimerase/dehydratase family protein [Natronomonas salina]QLD88491.1 NAD-dependent epimerase/dehydratase family protein [Natronomonas salina]